MQGQKLVYYNRSKTQKTLLIMFYFKGCLDFKSIDSKSYLKSQYFKGLKSIVDLSNPNL